MEEIHVTARAFELSLALEAMAFGGEQPLSFDAPIDCVNCEGSGRDEDAVCSFCDGIGIITDRRRTAITIPGALDDGEVLELHAEGLGTLTVTVREQPHPVFKRAGEHLRTSLDVPAKVLATGGIVNVETLDDDRELEIPAGSGEGTVVRLRGHGYPSKEDPERRGDLLVKLSETPATTPVEREERRWGVSLTAVGIAVVLFGIGIMVTALVIRSNATVCEPGGNTVCAIAADGPVADETDFAEARRREQNEDAALGVAIGIAVMIAGGWLTTRGINEMGRDRNEQRRT
ncbi:DnaJ C-terminal domain-containing protein [Glycomyces algeriensis]|uniref:Chaperone DnaJ C-terminal domain-containing protein n=1 Tax=Glycomyces algeriensis TaxID=256037 RepID=A0A9W6GAS0_9ACTN|nr:DnaJ C-terminal domain-containing protein [Glycomyces algeriensis]MDA1364607.1 hypothetical protein [Glycomyces algeriensis]MDR7350644.1 hypothetical protein [Glycomyces algeriensis]GLI43353.1 hypothetical protein GALLR39Z86_32030 [Glycomyces algeriensis]